MNSIGKPRGGISRRGFLLGATGGLIAGASLSWLAFRQFPLVLPSSMPVSPEESTERTAYVTSDSMPGRYPGRVIEVRHPAAVSQDHRINAPVVNQMVDRGMAELTGYEPGDPNCWRCLFDRDDVIGIKVNPVGRKPLKEEVQRGQRSHLAVGSISSPELIVKIVHSLMEIGVPARNIIIFERYANEFLDTGYGDLVERELPRGVRWMTAAASYSGQQLDIRGFDPDCATLSPEAEKHVVGYDPDVFTTMGFCDPKHSTRDDRRFRSHLSMVVSRLVNKMITLPVLKDHRSGGVTLSLKNMSHGMNNNVARSHIAGIAHGFGPFEKVLGLNQCNTFIPQAVSQQRLRDRATLHILDGLIGVYEGGPGSWNRTWATWRHKGLFFATDPVALDHVCWDIIDVRRAEEGWPPVERMGWLQQPDYAQAASSVVPLAGSSAVAAVPLLAGTINRMEARGTESFNLRQPDHVMHAGMLGLGVFERDQITYRSIMLDG